MKSCEKQLIYLIACALHDTAPDAAVTADIDFEALFRLAKAHSLTAITCMGLEKGGAFDSVPDETAKKWKEAKDKAIRKIMLMDAECRKITDYMRSEGIRYMPLKGMIMKDIYPKYGMRQMADYDILYDNAGKSGDSAQKKLHAFMTGRGYQSKSVGVGVHDAYYKPPIYNFELHRALFGEIHGHIPDEYYKNVSEKLLSDDGLCYRFSDEDFYIYMTAHAYKHFSVSGTGLRTLVDFYVYNLKKGGGMNWKYLRSELKALEIAEYESASRLLADKLFAEPEPDFADSLTEEESRLLEYYLGSGTYGTVSNLVSKKMTDIQGDGKPIRGGTRLKYILSRLFPGRQWCRESYPFFYKYPVFLPALWVYRIFRGMIKRRKNIVGEIRAVKGSKRKEYGGLKD